MRSEYNDVGDFHAKFDLDNTNQNGTGPRNVDRATLDYRTAFLQEELNEWMAAVDQRDIAEMADALVDLVYVALGTAHLLGLPWEDLWDEVHAANLRKRRATTLDLAPRNNTLDVYKPEGWEPPDLERVLHDHGWEI